MNEELKLIIDDIIRTGQYTSSAHEGGKYVKLFEEELLKYLGREAILVNSGTSALITALHLAGVGHGDQVIIPAYSFRATKNAVLAVGAEPVCADIKLDDFTINPEKIIVTGRTKAIIAVHLYGNIADIPAIKKKVEGKNMYDNSYDGGVVPSGIKIIEDSAQAFGSIAPNYQKAGTLADFGCFSFYPSKIINTMEGGAVTVSNEVDGHNARLFRNHGSLNHGGEPMWGLNLRMNEISAGMGLVQLKRIEEIIMKKKTSERRWYDILHRCEDLTIQPVNLKTNGQLFTFLANDREKWLNKLPQARVYYDYTLADNNRKEELFPNAVYASEHSISMLN